MIQFNSIRFDFIAMTLLIACSQCSVQKPTSCFSKNQRRKATSARVAWQEQVQEQMERNPRVLQQHYVKGILSVALLGHQW
jgi:type II secretory pathway component PulC